jgi:hypothetical protein
MSLSLSFARCYYYICTHLQHCENFLRQFIIKVAVFGVAHVVDEDETIALGVVRLEGGI